jgi:hypothetical protein
MEIQIELSNSFCQELISMLYQLKSVLVVNQELKVGSQVVKTLEMIMVMKKAQQMLEETHSHSFNRIQTSP